MMNFYCYTQDKKRLHYLWCVLVHFLKTFCETLSLIHHHTLIFNAVKMFPGFFFEITPNLSRGIGVDECPTSLSYNGWNGGIPF